MVRQSLKADPTYDATQSLQPDPIGDATKYLEQQIKDLGEQYGRIADDANRKYKEWEALQNRLEQVQEGHERLRAALAALERHPTGNGQDNSPATSTGPYEVTPHQDWVVEEVEEADEASELLPATEPVEDSVVKEPEPPPQAA